MKQNIIELKEMREDKVLEEFVRQLEDFKDKSKENLIDLEGLNIRDSKIVKETHVSIYLVKDKKKDYVWYLKQHPDVFIWYNADMTGLSTSTVAYRLPANPSCPSVKLKIRKYKPDLSLKINEEISKKIEAGILHVMKYSIWLCAYH